MNLKTRLIRTLGFLISGSAVCAFAILLHAESDLSQDGIEIRSSEGLVSAVIKDAEFRQVLMHITSRHGIKIWIADDIEFPPITDRFENLTVDESIRRLISKQNHVLVLDRKNNETQLHQIFIFPPGEMSNSQNLNSISRRVMVKPPYLSHPISGIDAEVLAEILESDEFPDNMKAALLDQSLRIKQLSTQNQDISRLEAVARIADVLERNGAAKPSTIQLLHDQLEKEQMNRQVEE